MKKPAKKVAPISFQRITARRKQYDEVAVAYDAFHSAQHTLLVALDDDTKALRREIALRDSLRASTLKISKHTRK